MQVRRGNDPGLRLLSGMSLSLHEQQTEERFPILVVGKSISDLEKLSEGVSDSRLQILWLDGLEQLYIV